MAAKYSPPHASHACHLPGLATARLRSLHFKHCSSSLAFRYNAIIPPAAAAAGGEGGGAPGRKKKKKKGKGEKGEVQGGAAVGEGGKKKRRKRDGSGSGSGGDGDSWYGGDGFDDLIDDRSVSGF